MKKKCILLAALSATMEMYATNPERLDTLRTYELQNVQVTSTRASKNTPMAFKNLNQAQIKKVNFGQDLPYVLSFTPSVTTTSDAGNGIGYTTLRIRGIDPSRINVTANGIPLNDAEDDQAYWINMGDIVSSVQNLQVQRGVGTSTNGSGAFGATINMQTENIGTIPYLSLDLSGGSYYSHKETLRFGTGLLGGHWGVQGRLSNIGSHGYLERAHTKLNNYFLQGGYFSDNTMVKLITFSGKEQTYHAWNYASKYEQSLYGRRYNSCGLMYEDADGTMHYYKDQTDNYYQQNYQLIWNQILSKMWNFNITLHYTNGNGYYNEYKKNKNLQDYGLSDVKYESDLTRMKKMDNDFYGAIASINYNNNKNFKATLGSGWNRYDGDHFGIVNWVKSPAKTFYPNYEYYRNNALKNDFNVYGKAEWNLWKNLNAYIDLQYRHVGYRMQDPEDDVYADHSGKYIIHDVFDFFNPKAGLNYQLDTHNQIYFSYAISHKEPTRNDYQDNSVRTLKAEKLQDYELGYKYQSRHFSAGANFYYMYYDHQYVLTGALNDIGEAIASNNNSGRSYRSGIELEVAWHPVNWFRWDVNATFSDNKAKDWTVTLNDGSTYDLGKTHLSFSPDAIFNNIFTFAYEGFTGSIQSQYIGKQYLTNTNFKNYNNYDADGAFDRTVSMMLDRHFTTNIDIAYNFSMKKFGIKDATIGISLYNLFSTKFDNNGWASPSFRKDANGKVEAYCSDDLYEAGFAPSAPFNYMAHLSINF